MIVTLAFPFRTTQATTEAAGSIYWGAYIDGGHYGLSDAPWNTQAMDLFEAHTQKKISILHWGQSWMNCKDGPCSYQYFNGQEPMYDKMRARGVIPLVDWASQQLPSPDPKYQQPAFALRAIINGDHDAYIRTWAQQAKAWGHPFFLRFNWEMNGTWYAWSEKRNGNQPGEYARAWRHVHDIFEQVGASNVTWVWCVNTIYANSVPIEGLYPGDAYVDWTCVDGYNRGESPVKNDQWRSFRDVFSATYDALLAIAPDKPIMIGETASTEYGGSKADWIRNALTNALPTYFPRIKAVLWFNWNDGGMDWVIETSAEAQQAFAQSIASSYYAQNEFAGLSRSPIPPRDQLYAATAVPPTATRTSPPLPTATRTSPPLPTATRTSPPPPTPTRTVPPPTAAAPTRSAPPTVAPTAVPPLSGGSYPLYLPFIRK
ncbi:MAG: glycoside hydrolase family 26 protein [Chloroflexota bacterium]